MQKPLIFSGGEDFRELRERGSCYVDKTDMIAKFAGAASAKVSLITRPRRFGKTLMLSTLRESFRIDASSASLFEGLNISRQKEFCAEHMNAYPTLFLSLSFQNADTFEHLSFAPFPTKNLDNNKNILKKTGRYLRICLLFCLYL